MAELERPAGDAAETPAPRPPASVSMGCMAVWWLLILAILFMFVWWFWVLPRWGYYDAPRERPPGAPVNEPVGPGP